MKRIFSNLSIKSRVTLMLVFVTLLSSIVIGLLGWRNGQIALEQAIVKQLTSVRLSQTLQIEEYFNQIIRHTRTLAEDRMMVNAVKQFKIGFNVGLNRTLTTEQHQRVSQFYEKQFAPKLALSHDNGEFPILYRPRRNVTSYFQYHYLVDNPYPMGSKEGMTESEHDTTFYSRFHKFYHPLLRNLQREFDYYDLFLIDMESLNVVYSVFKETDFATSLSDGPYRESGLGILAQEIKARPERGTAKIIDYRVYAPSYGAPAAFVGAPIFDGNEAVGILAFQLPADRINSVMTNQLSWEKNGLGKTGESFLVGPDKFMRSVSRPFLDDKIGYTQRLRDNGVAVQTIRNIQSFKTTVLFQPVVSSSVNAAMEGKSGTHLATNYLGDSVLSSYGPLEVRGLDWSIVSEISEDEAFQPIRQLQRNILVWGVVLILVVAFLAMALARFFVRPIEKLTQGAQSLASGDNDTHVDLESDDEFGELAECFNSMSNTIRTQSDDITTLGAENNRLLHNILPPEIASRVLNGEQVADSLQQVSIANLKLRSSGDEALAANPADTAQHLTRLFGMLDELGESYDVERYKTMGNLYIAACGVTQTRLDHSKRVIDFAAAAAKLLMSYNTDHRTDFSLQTGIDSGAVSAGVIGTRRFSFELWGDVIDIAYQLCSIADRNSIVVSASVQDRLKTFYDFTALPDTANSGIRAYSLDKHALDVPTREGLAQST